jgi:hypothetical protein
MGKISIGIEDFRLKSSILFPIAQAGNDLRFPDLTQEVCTCWDQMRFNNRIPGAHKLSESESPLFACVYKV